MAKGNIERQAFLRLKIEELEGKIDDAEQEGREAHADDLRCALADLQDELKELED